MSEPGYCARCGEQVSSGDVFCASCGASLAIGSEEAGPTFPGPTRSERRSPFSRLPVWLRGGADRLVAVSSDPSTGGIRRLAGRAAGWFGDLPGILRLLAGVALALILLVPLSRVTLVASTLAFGVSIIVLTLRLVRRGRAGRWGIVAAASLVITLVSYGTYGVVYGDGDTGGSSPDAGRGPGSGNGTLSDAGSFVDPADSRLCLGSGDGPQDYSGPALDFRVVDSREAETRSGIRGLALMVGTSVYEGLDDIAQNLAVNPDGYDAVEVTIFAREWAYYTPSQGVQPLPGAPSPYATTYYVAHSEAGEKVIGMKEQNLNECGTSYEDGGYKWGTRSLY